MKNENLADGAGGAELSNKESKHGRPVSADLVRPETWGREQDHRAP